MPARVRAPAEWRNASAASVSWRASANSARTGGGITRSISRTISSASLSGRSSMIRIKSLAIGSISATVRACVQRSTAGTCTSQKLPSRSARTLYGSPVACRSRRIVVGLRPSWPLPPPVLPELRLAFLEYPLREHVPNFRMPRDRDPQAIQRVRRVSTTVPPGQRGEIDALRLCCCADHLHQLTCPHQSSLGRNPVPRQGCTRHYAKASRRQ